MSRKDDTVVCLCRVRRGTVDCPVHGPVSDRSGPYPCMGCQEREAADGEVYCQPCLDQHQANREADAWERWSNGDGLELLLSFTEAYDLPPAARKYAELIYRAGMIAGMDQAQEIYSNE